ncbi:MAG: fibrobacter succinogenes major paralogous domain-containing protein [Rikenella sp.]|nr:fibrobacter succinogenes major paralogous domain-containing protein [Rikenella sp.]
MWRDEAKTLFDPCPSGWRVPKSGYDISSPWQAFSATNGSIVGTGNTSGRLFTLVPGGPTIWYGTSGGRAHNSATLWQWQADGYLYIWSATKTSSASGSTFIFQCTTSITPSNIGSNYSGYGFQVRCVRE